MTRPNSRRKRYHREWVRAAVGVPPRTLLLADLAQPTDRMLWRYWRSLHPATDEVIYL